MVLTALREMVGRATTARKNLKSTMSAFITVAGTNVSTSQNVSRIVQPPRDVATTVITPATATSFLIADTSFAARQV